MKKRNIDREKEERERGRVYDCELWEVCVINEGLGKEEEVYRTVYETKENRASLAY